MCNYHMSRNSTIHLSMQKSSASQIGKKSPPPPLPSNIGPNQICTRTFLARQPHLNEWRVRRKSAYGQSQRSVLRPSAACCSVRTPPVTRHQPPPTPSVRTLSRGGGGGAG